MSGAKCPPLNHEFTVNGKMTGKGFKNFNIVVERCNTTTDPTCASDAMFTMIEAQVGGKFQLLMPIIHTNINIGQEQYRNLYLEEKNALTFSSQLGVVALAYIQEDTIETDISLMPYSEVQS